MWKWIAVILLFTITYSHCAKFGPDNSYTCHCKNDEQCNRDNGVCNEGCARGWSVASCQKQNVALGKPSEQVDTNGERTSDLAVDGDRTTNISSKCSDTGGNNKTITKWWMVDLAQDYPINNITIYYQSEPHWALTSLNGYSVHVKTENQEPELCYKDNTVGIFPPAVNNIQCSQVITGRYVNISNFHSNRDARTLVLCEVEIYVCSVGTFGSDCTNFCHCLNNERCSETGVCSSGCADGWTGTTCNQKCAEGFYGDGCQKKCGDRKCLNNPSCDHITGECKGGCSDGYTLTDCSKECAEGFYGDGCQKKCNNRKCLNSPSCDHITGECNGGCSDGYTLTDCSTACDSGIRYGAGCSKLCSKRNCLVETSPCNHINGSCEGGCKEGFSNIDCAKGCEAGVYGEGCSKKCSDRKCKESNLQCDSITGECIDGCLPGHQSIDCTRECDEGTHGQDCVSNCSVRFCQSVEEGSNIDGACVCLDGYEATKTDARAKEDSEIGSESNDHTWIIVAAISGLIVGFIIGVGVLFIIRRGSRTKDNNSVYNKVTGNRSRNNVTQETTINQPVTPSSSNTSNNQDDNPYDGLSIAYQNENAYAQLQNL